MVHPNKTKKIYPLNKLNKKNITRIVDIIRSLPLSKSCACRPSNTLKSSIEKSSCVKLPT